jgi:hypothetical protein
MRKQDPKAKEKKTTNVCHVSRWQSLKEKFLQQVLGWDKIRKISH